MLFFDNDKAGHNAVYGVDKQDGEHKPGILELLEPFIRVRVVGRHKFDPTTTSGAGNAIGSAG